MKIPSKRIEAKRTYLQLLAPSELKPAKSQDVRLRLRRIESCPASFYRYLYATVGKQYYWVERSTWTDEQIMAHLLQPCISLWVLYKAEALAGYFELKQHSDRSVEIAYFGLLPEFLGCGLGKHLLTCAVEQAWASGGNRVWLHTCSLDAPAALPNYVKRGFKPFRQEDFTLTIN